MEPTSHPCFSPPADPSIKIWRYMDFTKYVSLLESSSLFFSRSDMFDDPYEGATSHANATLRTMLYRDAGFSTDTYATMSAFAKWVRQWTYINCWHMNEHESAAMWRLYARTDEAVAIQSTYERLRKALPEDAYVGVVNYIDYENEFIQEGNSFWPFVYKRKSFEHERELRAVIQKIPTDGDGIKVGGLTNPEAGRLVPLIVADIVESVYVSPTAPRWFSELVSSVTRKYGHSFEVQYSALSKKPVF